MSLRTVLMALGSALLASPSASPPEALSTYAIELRSNEGGLDVRGSAVFPPLESDTGSFAILLSPLARDPRWSFRCNGRRLNIPASSNSEEGGDRRWILRLRQTCPAGSVAMIGFRYRLEAGTAAPQLRVAAESGFAGGGGELWYPQRSFAERQRGRIVLDLPAGLAAIATGALQRQDRTGGRQRFLFETSGPAKLAFAYGPYSEARIGSPSPLTILSTGTPEQAADLARNLAPRIDALERAFGPAPFRSLALVEIDFQSRVLGTSEYGMIFSDPSKMRGAFDGPYWAHEFGHQWWGVGIRPVSASPGAALLTEGLSQFGALLALEAVDGAAAAADYRRNGSGGSKAGSLALYRELLRAGQDRPMAAFLPQGAEEILLAHQLATTKGAIVLRYLAALAGAGRVNALLAEFFARHAGGRVAWADVEAALDRGTDGEFRWFLDQWLHGTAAPSVSVRYCIAGSRVRGEVHQPEAAIRLPLPVEMTGAWGSVRALVRAEGRSSRFNLPAPGPVDAVRFDPDAVVPTASFAAGTHCPASGRAAEGR